MMMDGMTKEQARRLLALMDAPEMEKLSPTDALDMVVLMILREFLKDVAKGDK